MSEAELPSFSTGLKFTSRGLTSPQLHGDRHEAPLYNTTSVCRSLSDMSLLVKRAMLV
jgi:hypothetical protein